MSMNIRGNTDYSLLFSSLSTKQSPSASFFGSSGNMSDLTSTVLGGSKSSGGINLGDYASIKNGSYKKLLKSYFNMKAEQEKVVADETTKADEKTDKTNTDKVTTSEADKNGKVLATTWDDIVAKAEAKTDAMYTELGMKTGTTSAGSYLDTLI
mgnify:CR=1 FL=1